MLKSKVEVQITATKETWRKIASAGEQISSDLVTTLMETVAKGCQVSTDSVELTFHVIDGVVGVHAANFRVEIRFAGEDAAFDQKKESLDILAYVLICDLEAHLNKRGIGGISVEIMPYQKTIFRSKAIL